MNEQAEFKTWAIVEVMGHNEYAGFVSSELIAGSPMLRVDVPETSRLAGFTKFFSMGAIYAITPCTEVTAKARAESRVLAPFDCWSVEHQVMKDLRSKGLLIEDQPEVKCKACNDSGCVYDLDDRGMMSCPVCTEYGNAGRQTQTKEDLK